MSKIIETNFIINKYRLVESGHELPIEIVERRNKDGSRNWAITQGGNVLMKNGEWEFEPSPSNRTDEFLKNARYATVDEAALKLREIGLIKN